MRTSRRRPQTAAPRPPVPPARGRRAHAGPPAEEPPVPDPVPDPRTVPAGGAPAGTRPRIRLRPATVRAKIVSLLMVPVVSLLGLWAFATVAAAQDVARLSRVRQADAEIRTPVAAALTELQAERRAAVRFLADPASDQAAALEQQARRTDDAVRRLRLGNRHTVADSGDYHGDVVTRLDTFVSRAEGLGATRKDVTGRRATPDGAYAVYTEAADSALAVEGALSGGQDPEPGPDRRVLLEFTRAGEMLSREDVLLAVPGPRSPDALRRLTGVIENRRTLTAATAPDLPAAQRAAWESVAKSASYAELTGAEDKALAAAPVATAPAGGATAQREAPARRRAECPPGGRRRTRASAARCATSGWPPPPGPRAGPTRSPRACSAPPGRRYCWGWPPSPPRWSSPSASAAPWSSNWSRCATPPWRSPTASSRTPWTGSARAGPWTSTPASRPGPCPDGPARTRSHRSVPRCPPSTGRL